MKRKIFYTELAYVFGIIALAIGTAFMERADFGLSMVVAPAYVLHLKLSQYLPFFTFGMAEYCLQAVIIATMAIILRKFKLSYLFSFGTAVIYGVALDGVMGLTVFLPADVIWLRIAYFVVGLLLCSGGVSLFFHTYISPEAYELFVKEVSVALHIDINKFKTMYDCVSCVAGIILSFVFFGFGHLKGINVGTILCALINGFLISKYTTLFEGIYEFKDGLKLRKYFE